MARRGGVDRRRVSARRGTGHGRDGVSMARVALGITGGIGAYKAVEVARGLQKRGHDVVAVMTRNARRFVGPVTFEAITRHPVVTSQWTAGANADIEHISLASSIDLLLVAPATANILGKFAVGIADDFLSALYLATTRAGARRSRDELQHAGAPGGAAEPAHASRRAASGSSNRAPAIWPAAGSARAASPSPRTSWRPPTGSCAVSATLEGRRVLVTAGPTFEDLDPVRFLGNRSSGRMGFALAGEAARRVRRSRWSRGRPRSTRRATPISSGCEARPRCTTPSWRTLDAADIVIMAAAVADYAPVAKDDRKRREVGRRDHRWRCAGRRTSSRVSAPGARRGAVPGRCSSASPPRPTTRWRRDGRSSRRSRPTSSWRTTCWSPGAGFEVDTNVVTLVGPGWEEALPLQPKASVAVAILDRAELLLGAQAGRRGMTGAP